MNEWHQNLTTLSTGNKRTSYTAKTFQHTETDVTITITITRNMIASEVA